MTNVEHTIDSSTWTTNITGMMRSTIGYIFKDKTVDDETQELIDNLTGTAAEGIKQKIKTNPDPEQQPKDKNIGKNYATAGSSTVEEQNISGTAVNAELGNNPAGGGARFINPYGYATETDLGTGEQSDLSQEQVEGLFQVEGDG